MKKRICAVLLAMLVCFTLASPAIAAANTPEDIVAPCYSNITSISSSLSLENSYTGQLRCVGHAASRNVSDTIQLTMSLYRVEGYSSTEIKTWTTSGTLSCGLNKAWCVVSGYKYRLRVTAQVYNASGVYQETASATYTYDFT